MRTIPDYMSTVIKNNPGATRRDWELIAWDQFEKDIEMRRVFFNTCVSNFFKGYKIDQPSPEETNVLKKTKGNGTGKPAPSAPEPNITPRRHHSNNNDPRPAGQAEAAAAAAKAAEKEKRRTVITVSLFQWSMSQPRPILIKLGGVYADLAKPCKGDQRPSDVMTRREGLNIFSRHGMDVPNVESGIAAE
jgi:hypothetical protein